MPVHGFAYILNPAAAKKPMRKGMCPDRQIDFDDYDFTLTNLESYVTTFCENEDQAKVAMLQYEEFCMSLTSKETNNPRGY